MDFCYVRPHHVAAVNRLAREHFWPGVDVSESLAHPDFSVVALYRRMVVGFAFMLPNASNTGTYERGSGFPVNVPDQTYLLYSHLSQCFKRDYSFNTS